MPPTLPALDTILDLLPDAVCIVDPDGHFLFASAAFQRIFGYRPDEVLGRQMLDLVHPDDRATTLQAARRVMQGLALPHFRNRYLRRDGSVVDVQWSARWLPEHGVRIAVAHEVTELRSLERQLEHLASHDPLTGLPNRHRLLHALEQAITANHDSGRVLGVLYLDLDGFKTANDRHGHDAGDGVLRDVARRLRQGVRSSDLVARVGGDEFVALLPDCDGVAQVQAIADALGGHLLGLGRELDEAMRIGASIGVACHPGDGDSPDALLRSADRAMYAVKAARRPAIRDTATSADLV